MTEEIKHKHILIIEDDDMLSALLERELSKEDFIVTIARDGETGLEQARKNNPDLVLLDMMLPKLDGMSILQALHDEKIIPTLPVIVISNSGQPVETNRAKELGARDTLVKLNFSPSEVKEKVLSVLKLNRTPDINITSSEDMPVKEEGSVAQSTDHSEPEALNKIDPNQESEEIEGSLQHAEDKTQRNISLLLVEDDPFLAGMLERKLTEQGFVVHRTDTVENARTILKEKEGEINLICLDLILPGEDGFTLLQEVKENESMKNIPVLILSNLGQQSDLDKAKKLGAADYAIKANTSPNAIVKKVKELLGID
jgi:DNA-binding response OmpR family regulator